MGITFEEVSRWLIPRRAKVHIVILLLSLLMIPGAMTALQPIDMESYELDSPELVAQEIINEEFSDAEIILGFLVSARDPQYIPALDEWQPVTTLPDGTPDYSALPPVQQMIPAGQQWAGVNEPTAGIMNLEILREIDAKTQIIANHPLAPALKPFISDVTGLQTNGSMSLPDHFRGFMNGSSILTQDEISPFGTVIPAATNWSDCGELQCLLFDDENLTQEHIDLAAARMAEVSQNYFLRWLSLDRGFVADVNSNITGPIGGQLDSQGEWHSHTYGKGRWSASATWLLVQFDRGLLEDMGWELTWKDSHQEKEVTFSDDGIIIGGYRIADGNMVLNPPQYSAEQCQNLTQQGAGCSTEWSYMDLEGQLRSHDRTTITLLLGQGINVEVNRELQESGGLIILMGIVVTGLLFVSLRRWSDVIIVLFSLAAALLWMQGLIGHFAAFTQMFGWTIIARSQFSNLLPILVLALGIDDSLHALHRYKEERNNGEAADSAATITLARVGRAIMLTSLTTMSAFAANLFSDVAALRSFGIEAALGIFAAFVLTGIWTPLIRLSVDQWLERRNKYNAISEDKNNQTTTRILKGVAVGSGTRKNAFVIAFLALLVTIPAAIGMANLEGDFAVEDFLDESSDFAVGVNEITLRFSDEGEPAVLLLQGDVADPAVFAAIDLFRSELNVHADDIPDKITRQPDGNIDILALDEMLYFAQASMRYNTTPFEQAGWLVDEPGHGMNCSSSGNSGIADFSDRDCLIFFYGYSYLYGIPGAGPIPTIPPSIVRLYIKPHVELNQTHPWFDIDGQPAQYQQMLMRFGITSPEDFPSMKIGMQELWRDLSVFTNLSSGTYQSGGQKSDDKPLTWVMLSERPVTRYVASTAMQDEMQSSLLLGSLFVFITLTIGFKSPKQATVTMVPILLVVVWLYGLMYAAGASLNIVTVTIATISLGVGIDYCIHVTERYREGREKGESHHVALVGVGGACGLALVGSAASDIAGFLVIAMSPMGLFSNFGIYSAAMIALSLVASLVLTTAALGLVAERQPKLSESE